MNKAAMIVVLLLLGVGAWWYLPSMTGQTTQEPTTSEVMEGKVAALNTVELKDFAFNPTILTVKVGSTVTFKNSDIAGHSVTADDKSFDSGVLGQGETATVTFDKAGTFGFHCTPHPNMKVSIVVEQ